MKSISSKWLVKRLVESMNTLSQKVLSFSFSLLILLMPWTQARATVTAIDFIGIVKTQTGDFIALSGPIWGTIFADTALPFVLRNDPFIALDPLNRNREAHAVSSSLLDNALTQMIVNFGGFRFSTPEPTVSGSLDYAVRAIDNNPFGADDYVIYDYFSDVNRFGWQIIADDLIGADPSLGFSLGLLQSINFASALDETKNGVTSGSVDFFRSEISGRFTFDITSISVREASALPPFQGTITRITTVPLPKTLVLLLPVLGWLVWYRGSPIIEDSRGILRNG